MIEIRFIKDRDSIFLAQRKRWYGWKYISYTSGCGSGDSVEIVHSAKSKKKLLKKIIDDKQWGYYKIAVHPTIKIQ